MEQGSRYFLNEELAFFNKTVKKGTVLVVAGVFLAAAVWTGLSLPPHSTTGAFPFDLVVGVLGTTFDLLRAQAAHPITVAILALLGLERALFWVRRRSWPSAATAGNLLSYLLGLFASGVTVLGFVQAYRWCYDHLRLFDPLGTPWAFCLALIGVDFILYWVHRLFHRVGFLWAVHSVHHSCQTLNASVALRQSWLFSFLIYLYFFLPLALLGINLMQLITASALTSAWAAMCHTTIIAKFGVLERFLNTPSNHRVHHGRQGRYLDRNFSNRFFLWDRLFGTYQAEEEEPDYGLTVQVESNNPLIFQFAGFASLYRRMQGAEGLADKLRYLYKPPEWSHLPANPE